MEVAGEFPRCSIIFDFLELEIASPLFVNSI